MFELAVTDTGIGISPEDQGSLFEEFRQAAGAGHGQGTGLGLALARRFVEAMGGQVRVSSRVGMGSTFTIELPLSQHTPA